MPDNKPKYVSPIQKQRKKLGITQDALAAMLAEMGVHLTRQEVSNWERGKAKVPARILPLLDRALDLMDGTLYYELNLKRHGGDD